MYAFFCAAAACVELSVVVVIRFILSPRAHSAGKSARGNEPTRQAVRGHADSRLTNSTEAVGADPTLRGSHGRDRAHSPKYFCMKHAPKHSVHYSQLCSHPHCFKVASYVSQQQELRRSNSRLDSRSVSATPTLSHVARRNMSMPRRQVFCAAHAPEGVSDYRHLKCCAQACNRQGLWMDPLASASHNVEAYCHVHRHDEMVLRSTRRPGRMLGGGSEEARRGRRRSYLKCMHPLGCELFASFGEPGDKPRFCASHKAAHHINCRKSCMVPGCSARPMYGVDHVLTHCGVHRSLSVRTRVSACVWSCVCARARCYVSERGEA